MESKNHFSSSESKLEQIYSSRQGIEDALEQLGISLELFEWKSHQGLDYLCHKEQQHFVAFPYQGGLTFVHSFIKENTSINPQILGSISLVSSTVSAAAKRASFSDQ